MLRAYLIGVTILFALCLPVSIVALWQSDKLMLGVAAEHRTLVQIAYWSIVSYPLTLIVAAASAWHAHLKERSAALVVGYTLLPLINLVVLMAISRVAR